MLLEFYKKIFFGGVPMKKWTKWFYSPSERRAYIRAQRKKAKKEGKKLCVLKRSYCIQRCSKKVMYFADLAIR